MAKDTNGTEGAGGPASVKPDREVLALLHVAEYNAVTTRITYWLTLQIAIWSAVFVVAGLGATLLGRFSTHRTLLLCGTFGIAQMLVLIWYNVTNELFQAARFLRHDLKPEVRDSLQLSSSAFWMYEDLTARHRGFAPIWEWGPAGVAAASLIILFATLKPSSPAAWVGFSLNALLVAAMIGLAAVLTASRKQADAPPKVAPPAPPEE
jgi:hypothetical protein